jgi:LysR family transcriptional regulator (chromosome initiation inhibitor)
LKVDLGHLEVLLAVVEEGTFEAAAVVLRVTPSAVSQRIRALEHQAGKVLLQRTKPVTPTDAAIPYLQAARQIKAVVDQTLQPALDPAAPLPSIPLAINADSLDTWVVEALASIRDVATFHLFREDQEHTADLLRSGRVMAGITSQETAVQGCESTRLGVMRYLALGSPDFVAQWFPHGPTSEALAQAPVVEFDRKDNLQRQFMELHGASDARPPTNYIPTNQSFREAILQDLGWGMVPELWARPLIESGAAVHLGGHTDVTLYWQQWKVSSLPLETVRSAILDAASYSLRIS